MGVPLLLTWLRSNFNGAFRQYNVAGDSIYGNVFVDFNSLLYAAADQLMVPESASDEPSVPQLAPEEYEDRLLRSVAVMLDEIVAMLKPKNLLYLAVDGVSPRAKLAQQRMRRFKHRNGEPNGAVWDRNAITAGSAFMQRVGAVLEWYAVSRAAEGSEGASIIVSDAAVPGEGETKILSFMRSCSDTGGLRQCVVSSDSDMVLCLLLLHDPRIDILRFTPSIECTLFDIGVFRGLLRSRLGDMDAECFERCLHDVAFILLLFGTDFLPSLPQLSINAGHLDELIDSVVRDIASQGKHLVDARTAKIVVPSVQYFLETALGEADAVPSKRQRCEPLKVMNGLDPAAEWGFGEPTHTHESDEAVLRMSHDYWEGLQWSVQYYSGDCPSWTWLYPHCHAPTPKDLCRFPASIRVRHEDKPIGVFEQLLLLLPPESQERLLPKCFLRGLESSLHEMLAATVVAEHTFEKVEEFVASVQHRLLPAERERQMLKKPLLVTWIATQSTQVNRSDPVASSTPNVVQAVSAANPLDTLLSITSSGSHALPGIDDDTLFDPPKSASNNASCAARAPPSTGTAPAIMQPTREETAEATQLRELSPKSLGAFVGSGFVVTALCDAPQRVPSSFVCSDPRARIEFAHDVHVAVKATESGKTLTLSQFCWDWQQQQPRSVNLVPTSDLAASPKEAADANTQQSTFFDPQFAAEQRQRRELQKRVRQAMSAATAGAHISKATS